MSNGRKERIAVSAIEQETYKRESYLVAEIPVGDKAPSFDGYITVYKDDSEKAKSYINDVPTQVKGTEVKEFTKGTKEFRLDLVHYENYYKRGGCLLLVVEILDNTSTKIFYKSLLPVELKWIINNWGHQKSKTVELRPLDETSLYVVCRKIIDQMIKQPQILIEQNGYKEEDYEKLIFSSLTFNPYRDGPLDIFNHDFTQFGLKNNIEYPIKNMRVETIAIDDIEEIKIEKKVFRLLVKSIYSSKGTIKIIEDSLEFTMDNELNKIKFKFLRVKSLSTQLKVLPLLIEFLKSGEITFKDFFGNISIDEAKKYINQLEYTYDIFLKLKTLFKQLNIDEDIPFGSKDNIAIEIEHIIDVILNKDYSKIKVKNPHDASFFKFSIGDIYLVFFYNPNSNDKFINAFSEEFLNMPFQVIIKNTDRDETIPISPYLLLEKDTLINAKNINYDVVKKSFELINFKKSDIIFSPINNFCLVTLSTFDITGVQELLDISEVLLTKLMQSCKDEVLKNIAMVNLMQVKFRKNNKLLNKDFKELVKLKNSLVKFIQCRTKVLY